MMSMLFNMLFKLTIAFLSSSKCLLISWLLSLSAVILEPKKIKSNGLISCKYVKKNQLELKKEVVLYSSTTGDHLLST